MRLDRERAGVGLGGAAVCLSLVLLGLHALGCGTSSGAGSSVARGGPSEGAATAAPSSRAQPAPTSSVGSASSSGAADAAMPGSDLDAGAADGGPSASGELSELARANARWLPACALTAASAEPGGPPPAIKAPGPTVAFPFEAVRRMVRKSASRAIDACVREGRKRIPDLAGVVLLRFKLPNGGAMEQVEVVQGVGDPALHGCVAGALAKTKIADLKLHGIVLSNVPVVACGDGRTLLWPELPPATESPTP